MSLRQQTCVSLYSDFVVCFPEKMAQKIHIPVEGARMALVVGSDVFVTSYDENRIIRMPWPACDCINGCLEVHRPRGIVNCNEHLLVACFGDPVGCVVTVDPVNMRIVHTFPAYRPRGIEFWNGLVLVSEVNRGRIAGYTREGKQIRTWTGFNEPRDLCVWENEMLIADTGNDRIARVDLNTSTITDFAHLARPNGVASDGANVIVTQWNTGLITKFSKTDLQTTTSYTAGTPCMARWSGHCCLVVDATENCVYSI